MGTAPASDDQTCRTSHGNNQGAASSILAAADRSRYFAPGPRTLAHDRREDVPRSERKRPEHDRSDERRHDRRRQQPERD